MLRFSEWALLRSAQYRDSFDGYDVSHVSGCDLLNHVKMNDIEQKMENITDVLDFSHLLESFYYLV